MQYLPPEAYEMEEEHVSRLLEASSGFEKMKLQAQLEDAQAGRANAMKIAQLQSANQLKIATMQDKTQRYGIDVGAKTQRYGVDVGRQNLLDQLLEQARQFDARHGLEIEQIGLQRQQLGLEHAKTYAAFASTPDLFFQRADYMDAADRAMKGLGPTPYAWEANPYKPPVAKTFDDYAQMANRNMDAPQMATPQLPAALTNAVNQQAQTVQQTATSPLGQTFANQGQGQDTGQATGQAGGQGFTTNTADSLKVSLPGSPGASTATAAAPAASGGAPTSATGMPDPRINVLTAMMKAMPPSEGAGLNEADQAVLNAATELIKAPRPGSFERLRPDQRAITLAAVKRNGGSAQDWLENYLRSAPSQGSVRAA